MKPITIEWINKAEGDYAVMEREGRVRKHPNFDGVCFHAQQCAEKYLKAWLIEADIDFPKTHDRVMKSASRQNGPCRYSRRITSA